MAKAVPEVSTKFIVEYFTDDKKLDSRWHYNYSKTRNGPVLVEHFNFTEKKKEKNNKKK